MDSVKEVAAAKTDKPSKDEQRPAKKSILADLKEKQSIVAAATTAAVAENYWPDVCGVSQLTSA